MGVVDADAVRAAEVAAAVRDAGGGARHRPGRTRRRGLRGGADRSPRRGRASAARGRHPRPGREADDSLAGRSRRLLAAAAQSGALLAVGHIEHFNPAVQAARPHIHEPRFIEVHRLGTFPERSLDIDVVFDLMIHDLGLVLELVGSEVTGIEAVGVPVLTPRVDIANARLKFANGCIANLTASRISRDQVRKIRFFQRNTYLSIDYKAQEVEAWRLVPQDGGMPRSTAASSTSSGRAASPRARRLRRRRQGRPRPGRHRRAGPRGPGAGERDCHADGLTVNDMELMPQSPNGPATGEVLTEARAASAGRGRRALAGHARRRGSAQLVLATWSAMHACSTSTPTRGR